MPVRPTIDTAARVLGQLARGAKHRVTVAKGGQLFVAKLCTRGCAHNAHSVVMPCMDLDAHLGNTEMYGMPFRGAVIFEAGDIGLEAYRIVRGAVRVLVEQGEIGGSQRHTDRP